MAKSRVLSLVVASWVLADTNLVAAQGAPPIPLPTDTQPNTPPAGGNANTVSSPTGPPPTAPNVASDPTPSAAPKATTETPPEPPPSTPPPAVAPPASAASTLSAVMAALPIKIYGTLRAMVDVTNGVETFGNPNASAMTAAANPLFLATPDSPYLSFQVQQSRAGIVVGEGSPVKAQLEFDFIHFDQASPTVQAYPRVRIAEASWEPSKGHRLFIGQNWDLFSPVNNHTNNMVGNLFQAGNLGFMRHQLGYIGRFGGFELAMALGFQGSNAGPSFGNLEVDSIPTGSLRLGYRTAKNGWFGVSALGSAPRFIKGTDSERRAAYGVNAFADLNLGPLNLRAEAYFAQNLANMGTLDLAFGRFGTDMKDAGGYISARANLGKHALYMLGGAAGIINTDDLIPGYTAATLTAAAVRNAALGPGIEWNASIHLGYQFSPWKGLSLVLEPLLYVTKHKLFDADLMNGTDPRRVTPGIEFGALYTF